MFEELWIVFRTFFVFFNGLKCVNNRLVCIIKKGVPNYCISCTLETSQPLGANTLMQKLLLACIF